MTLRKGDLTQEQADLLVVNLFQGVKELGGATGAVDAALEGYLSEVIKEEHFSGKLGSTVLVRTEGVIPAKRVLVVGLGKKETFSEEVVRQAAAISYHAAQKLRAKRVVTVMHGVGAGAIEAAISAKAIVEGVRLAAYTFTSYKKKQAKTYVEQFDIVTKDGRKVRNGQKGVELAELFVEGAALARDLVNTPASDMVPETLVDVAKRIQKESKGKIRTKVMDKAKLEQMGANAFLGIARGSVNEPYMVHMRYNPPGAKKRIALVGKGITFDSGGLSIKPAESMYTMKLDMGGAATVLGVFQVLAQLQPKIAVDGIFAACENMPGGDAIKPGDVVKAMNGKTIEVLHTDAEGRVTLADSLSYAERQKPDMIIDLATLTGACMVALGEEIVGVMSTDAALENKILNAAAEAGEKMWSLPLEKNYKRELKSEVADVKNIGGRYGGALTAGLFLQEFVEKTPWAHMDIAGPSFAERPINSYTQKGGTGVGVRTLLTLIRSI